MSQNNNLKIESQDVTIENLYKDFYAVPDFQREYVWEREQVEKMLQDLTMSFSMNMGNLLKGLNISWKNSCM